MLQRIGIGKGLLKYGLKTGKKGIRMKRAMIKVIFILKKWLISKWNIVNYLYLIRFIIIFCAFCFLSSIKIMKIVVIGMGVKKVSIIAFIWKRFKEKLFYNKYAFYWIGFSMTRPRFQKIEVLDFSNDIHPEEHVLDEWFLNRSLYSMYSI